MKDRAQVWIENRFEHAERPILREASSKRNVTDEQTNITAVSGLGFFRATKSMPCSFACLHDVEKKGKALARRSLRRYICQPSCSASNSVLTKNVVFSEIESHCGLAATLLSETDGTESLQRDGDKRTVVKLDGSDSNENVP